MCFKESRRKLSTPNLRLLTRLADRWVMTRGRVCGDHIREFSREEKTCGCLDSPILGGLQRLLWKNSAWPSGWKGLNRTGSAGGARKWGRLYWHTHGSNMVALRLYDGV